MTGPNCYCCGTHEGQLVHVWRGQWRCEKHVGRIPCCIEGCGRTYAIQPGEGYHFITICGRHWRMAPKRLRDLVTAIRRKAKRISKGKREDWPPKLEAQHHRVWEMCRRAILRALEGDMDVKEIHRLMGWDD